MSRLILALGLSAVLAMPAHAAGNDAAGSDAAKSPVPALLDALLHAGSEGQATMIESQLRRAFLNQASPATKLLMQRGLRELKAKEWKDAERDFGDALTLDPDYAEAYHERAIARWQSGDIGGATSDLAEALKQQPGDFGALQTLSQMAESHGDWTGALAAWQQLLKMDPKTPGGESRLKLLKRKALGENT